MTKSIMCSSTLIILLAVSCPTIGGAQTTSMPPVIQSSPPAHLKAPPPPPILPSAISAATIPYEILGEELKLTQDQQTRIRALQIDGREKWGSQRNLSVDDRNALQAQVDSVAAATAAQIVDLLSDQQKQMLTQLIDKLSILMPDQLPIPLAAQLYVSADQMHQIKAINDASLVDMMQKKKQFPPLVPFGELPRAEADMFQAVNRKRIKDVADILTPPQRNFIVLYSQQNPRFLWLLTDWLNALQAAPLQLPPAK